MHRQLCAHAFFQQPLRFCLGSPSLPNTEQRLAVPKAALELANRCSVSTL
jgi:hypothetical protein